MDYAWYIMGGFGLGFTIFILGTFLRFMVKGLTNPGTIDF